jgi:hypothetical protein
MQTTTLVGIGLGASLAVGFTTPSGWAAIFTSHTLIQSKGGSATNNKGGGGGGRIAVYQHCSLFSGSFQAGGGTGYQAGGTGTVYVVWVNAPPVLPNQSNVTLNELKALSVTNTASDRDGPPKELTYRLESPPDGASISPVGMITWVPSEAQGPGTYTIKTIVTDYNPLAITNQRLSATNSLTVTVNEINVAPALTLPPGVALDELTLLSANASAADSDWQNLWTNTPTVLPFSFIDTNAGSFSNCFYCVLLSP